jgi:polysaccharide export outer membrane protein
MRIDTMFWRTFCWLCLGSMLGLAPGPAQAAEQTNLVEILRAAMAAADGAAPATNQALTLASGDVLQLVVYQEEDLNLPHAVITRDGTISHPLLGALPVAGKSLEQAQAFIHDLLEKDYLVNPRVSLTIAEYAKYRLTLIKEVVRPSTYEVPRNKTMTLMEAIALAGGPSRQGNMSKVTIQRIVRGEKKELKLDAESKEGQAFVVEPDDVIEVPPKAR